MRVFYYPIEQKLTLPEDGVQYMSYGLCAYLIFGFSAMQIGYLPDISCDRRFVFCKNRHPSPICMQFGHHPAGVSAPLSRSEAPMPYNWFSTAIL